jgi:hypothetical protein
MDGNSNGHSDLGPLQRLEVENAQLRQALQSRIVIEQAKGILAERYRLDVDQAFAVLRRAARSNRMRLHTLAASVTPAASTPAEIEELLYLDSRRRAFRVEPAATVDRQSG